MSDRVRTVEALYEAVVTDPSRWNEQMFVDWTETVDTDGSLSKVEAKYVRRALRAAQSLRGFWLEAQDRPDLRWESRVDLAMGPKAWRPVLDLAEIQLHNSRTEDSFVEVARLFRLVNHEEFLDGIDFDEWRQTQK
ncbi:MAG: hypothetical protein ABFR53_01160 [Actinomycetota bacterium]